MQIEMNFGAVSMDRKQPEQKKPAPPQIVNDEREVLARLEGMTPMNRQRAENALRKLWRFHNGVKSHLQQWKEGAFSHKKKELSDPFQWNRVKYHRMGAAEAEEYERKFEQKVIKYFVYWNDGSGTSSEVPKMVWDALPLPENKTP